MTAGKMLRLAHTFLRTGGLLFLVVGYSSASTLLFTDFSQLPLPCVQNSRYLDINRLEGIFTAIGFEKVKERWKPKGKVAYWLYRKGSLAENTNHYTKKSVVREGVSRNNFCILL